MKIDKKLMALATAFLYLLAIRLVIVPNWQTAAQLRKETVDVKNSLRSPVDLNAQYQVLSELETALQDEGSTGLLSVVQNKAQKLGFSAKLKAVTPAVRELSTGFRLEGFDLRLEGVNLKEVVFFLESLSGEKGFYLDRLILEKSRDGMSLSARLRFLTIRKS